MSDDLTEFRERVDFAREEIATLRDQLQAFSKAGVLTRVAPTPGRNTVDIFISMTKPIPTGIRARAGTIANELRSCLDGLACALAIRNGENTNQTYFPISKTIEIFQDDGMRKIKKLSDKDKAIIISLKPWRAANPLLFGLHEADRTRKHIRLAGCGNATNEAIIGHGAMHFLGGGRGQIVNCQLNDVFVEDLTYFGGIAVDVGREVLVATGIPPRLPVRIVTGLSYADPPDLVGKPLATTLVEFSDAVSQVLDLFDHDLARPGT